MRDGRQPSHRCPRPNIHCEEDPRSRCGSEPRLGGMDPAGHAAIWSSLDGRQRLDGRQQTRHRGQPPDYAEQRPSPCCPLPCPCGEGYKRSAARGERDAGQVGSEAAGFAARRRRMGGRLAGAHRDRGERGQRRRGREEGVMGRWFFGHGARPYLGRWRAGARQRRQGGACEGSGRRRAGRGETRAGGGACLGHHSEHIRIGRDDRLGGRPWRGWRGGRDGRCPGV